LVAAVVFFFSSRRRHTRWPRDWSSDVCSSDLASRENGIFIHFFKNRAFVFDFLERDALQLLGQLFNPLTPVCFHYADDHVFAAAAPPQGFAEHAERFSYAGSVAQKKLKDAAGFLWRRDSFQPFFRFFGQRQLSIEREPELECTHAEIPRRTPP